MAVDHASSSLLVELEDEHGHPLIVTADGNDRAADREREGGGVSTNGSNVINRIIEYVSTSIDDHNEQEENSSRRRKIR